MSITLPKAFFIETIPVTSLEHVLFTEKYPGAQLIQHDMPDGYISDSLSEDKLSSMFCPSNNPLANYHPPILIWAQTGSRKNYWVTHTLRKYALSFDQKILYISNRVALDFQQKSELAREVNPLWSLSFNSPWENPDWYGNIYVTTYHKLYDQSDEDTVSFFKMFQYVVIDEAHFFYSDAQFNSKTGAILKKIIKSAQHCHRIYMTATPEDVLDPIYVNESIFYPNAKEIVYWQDPNTGCFNIPEDFPRMEVYKFKYDYSAYHDVLFFSNLNELNDIFIPTRKKGLTLCFVNSIKDGDKLIKLFEDIKLDAIFLSSKSKNSSDPSERITWDYLKQYGQWENADVLITTSALDNGFSVKDPRISNIILFSEDQTEFIQELGRVRLAPDQKVKIYIAKMTQDHVFNPKNHQKELDLFLQYYGSDEMKEYPKPDTCVRADKIAAFNMLWNTHEDYRRSFMNVLPDPSDSSGKLGLPEVNPMARWRCYRVSQQISAYEHLKAENEVFAPIIYKARWLDIPENDEVLSACDCTSFARQHVLKEYEEFMDSMIGRRMAETNKSENGKYDSEEMRIFVEFSEEFAKFYIKLFPKSSKTNTGKDRKVLKHGAIQSRINEIETAENGYVGTPHSLTKDSGYYIVIANPNNA